ncbi:MAG: hypothetical protein EBR67_10605 [Proteobacteria bacterium]|nr:hypothetical protein [Pseudomonadota bacterium]
MQKDQDSIINLLEDGIMEQDWSKICEVLFMMSGLRIPPPSKSPGCKLDDVARVKDCLKTCIRLLESSNNDERDSAVNELGVFRNIDAGAIIESVKEESERVFDSNESEIPVEEPIIPKRRNNSTVTCSSCKKDFNGKRFTEKTTWADERPITIARCPHCKTTQNI